MLRSWKRIKDDQGGTGESAISSIPRHSHVCFENFDWHGGMKLKDTLAAPVSALYGGLSDSSP